MSKTVNTVLAEIKDELSIQDTDTDFDAKIIRMINHVFVNMKFAFILSRQGYFLSYTSLSVAAGEDEITVPSGIIQVRAVYYTPSPDDAGVRWRRLEPSPVMSLESREHGQSDEFSRYTIEGGILRLESRAMTSVTNGLKLFGVVSLETPLAAGGTIPLADDFVPCLEYGVYSRYRLGQRDYTAHEYYERLYESEKRLIKKIIHHQIEFIQEEIGFHPGEL